MTHLRALAALFLWATFVPSIYAADVRGSDGRLPGYWRIGIETWDGEVSLMCSQSPYVLFSDPTITCARPKDAPADNYRARIEGPSGPLGGWRIAAPDGEFLWRTICENPYADTDRNLVLCKK